MIKKNKKLSRGGATPREPGPWPGRSKIPALLPYNFNLAEAAAQVICWPIFSMHERMTPNTKQQMGTGRTTSTKATGWHLAPLLAAAGRARHAPTPLRHRRFAGRMAWHT
jgi:hypothetical protein